MSAKPYVFCWLGLLALTALSFGMSYVPLGKVEMGVALVIAVAKATLVALIFMHLRESIFSFRFILVVSVVWVLIMATFTTADLLTREENVPHPALAIPQPGN